MIKFPILKDQLYHNSIKVGNGISILAEFRYWTDCDEFCRLNSVMQNLYVWENDIPTSYWCNSVETYGRELDHVLYA